MQLYILKFLSTPAAKGPKGNVIIYFVYFKSALEKRAHSTLF